MPYVRSGWNCGLKTETTSTTNSMHVKPQRLTPPYQTNLANALNKIKINIALTNTFKSSKYKNKNNNNNKKPIVVCLLPNSMGAFTGIVLHPWVLLQM